MNYYYTILLGYSKVDYSNWIMEECYPWMSIIPTADYVMLVFGLEMSVLTIMPVNYLQIFLKNRFFNNAF